MNGRGLLAATTLLSSGVGFFGASVASASTPILCNEAQPLAGKTVNGNVIVAASLNSGSVYHRPEPASGAGDPGGRPEGSTIMMPSSRS